MGTPTIIILVTLLVILATLIPSYRISKKKGVTESEWAIGGRALPLYVVVGTQFASSMGGGILVGQVGNAYSNGIGMLLYAILAEIPILCIIFVENGCEAIITPLFPSCWELFHVRIRSLQ